ncbi:hypothetical protein BO71DRAFT_223909 [Aspergillus ellipticus CBS 707.79]|uniref:Uncharacterized protein n=1 Tax=Aspergillus ellipticus CBS 707.79 TaxID=1448320 RepID=A0A319DP04_9EURO|nr:hypothetical protein BO71DRAFT_223909 [Aspergillus ellipticus CBS 707.79]
MVGEVNDLRRRIRTHGLYGHACLACRLALMLRQGRCEFDSEIHTILAFHNLCWGFVGWLAWLVFNIF